jgi:CBS domain-containing protein
MRTVRDVMHEDVEVLRTTETAADAAGFLATHDEETVPVCGSDGRLAGTVSTRDIVTEVVAKGRDPNQVRLAELAEQREVVALDADSTVEEAAALMCRHASTRLPVVERDRVVGLVTRRDVARSAAFQPWWDGA